MCVSLYTIGTVGARSTSGCMLMVMSRVLCTKVAHTMHSCRWSTEDDAAQGWYRYSVLGNTMVTVYLLPVVVMCTLLGTVACCLSVILTVDAKRYHSMYPISIGTTHDVATLHPSSYLSHTYAPTLRTHCVYPS